MNKNYYRYFNKDLYLMTDNELENHYLNTGINENRVYNSYSFDKIYNFNLDIYINYNEDLMYNGNYLYRKHFYEYGINENRIYNYDTLIAKNTLTLIYIFI